VQYSTSNIHLRWSGKALLIRYYLWYSHMGEVQYYMSIMMRGGWCIDIVILIPMTDDGGGPVFWRTLLCLHYCIQRLIPPCSVVHSGYSTLPAACCGGRRCIRYQLRCIVLMEEDAEHYSYYYYTWEIPFGRLQVEMYDLEEDIVVIRYPIDACYYSVFWPIMGQWRNAIVVVVLHCRLFIGILGRKWYLWEVTLVQVGMMLIPGEGGFLWKMQWLFWCILFITCIPTMLGQTIVSSVKYYYSDIILMMTVVIIHFFSTDDCYWWWYVLQWCEIVWPYSLMGRTVKSILISKFYYWPDLYREDAIDMWRRDRESILFLKAWWREMKIPPGRRGLHYSDDIIL